MSEEQRATPDISKVISVIMENPDILERISSLVKSDSEGAVSPPKESEDTVSAQSYANTNFQIGRSRRSQLLGALKPYVKKERAQAIDSVIAIADILDMMRRK